MQIFFHLVLFFIIFIPNILQAQELEKVKLHLFLKEQSTKQTNALQLTQKEKKWILAHPVVIYSEVNWKPLSIIKDGNIANLNQT